VRASTAPEKPPFGVSARPIIGLDEAWALTRVLSPRDYVQRAAEFVDGTYLNSYAAHHGLDEDAPAGPWAMWLTVRPGWFRFICFDFDAKSGRPAYDAARLSYWLHEVSIAHTVTESGPTGGRHVWIALDELTAGAAVHRVARLAKQLLPSLDPSPLSETGGAVRPPGAPHRVSGRSVPQGSLQPLLVPSTSSADVAALDALLVDLGAELEPVNVSLAHNVRKDPSGHPYLLGARRELSEYVRGLLEAAPAGDTSAAAASILAGCANARWRYDDVAALVEHSPGLEHLRTRRAGAQRLPRTRRQQARTLASTWASAVAYVSVNPAAADSDPTFPTRVEGVVAAIDRIQERANLTTGLWGGSRGRGVTGRGSLVFRAVLDALCVYMLQAASTEVEADTRRLAIDTGWSERRVGEVLTLLTADTDSWLQRAGERTDKARGQRFRLHPKFSTDQKPQTRAQVLARPAPATSAPDPLTSRALLIAELQVGLAPLRMDTFAAPHSLGRAAGHIYRLLTRTHAQTPGDIANASGFTVRQVRAYLDRLVFVGLSRRSRHGWLQTRRAPGPIAATFDVDGYLERREARYRAERSRWGLWLDELRWRRQKGSPKPRRRRLEQLTLTGLDERTRVRYPRGPGGRARHAHVLSALLALQDKRPGVHFR
jgi:hypothetical protein